jgi:cytochrome c biogenesis protein CcdA
MKFLDFIALCYVRFVAGFSVLAMAIGMINLGLITMTYLTVKGFNIPSVVILGIAGGILLCCVVVGTLLEKYRFWDKVTSLQNQRMNPEIRESHEMLKKLITDNEGKI